jgi:hypothetical protein
MGRPIYRWLSPFPTVVALWLMGCATKPPGSEALWSDASGQVRGDGELRRDSDSCTQVARREADTAATQFMRQPAAFDPSAVGVGVGLVIAQARVESAARDRAFIHCMAAADWQLRTSR